MTQHPDFYRAFDSSAEFSNALGDFRCVTRQIALLDVPGGQIVAGDPLVYLPDPFSTVAPPGEYPVLVAIAQLDGTQGADERIACAMVRFSDAAPERWVIGTTATQDPAELKENEIFGYGVDSGMGCFASVEAAVALQQRMEADDAYVDHIIAEAEKVYAHTRDWASVIPDVSRRGNVVTFSSGLGDGFYASYWGYDRAGSPVCLITDFGVVGPDHHDDVPRAGETSGIARKVFEAFQRWIGR